MVSGRYLSADMAFSWTKVIPLRSGGTSSKRTGGGAEAERRGSRSPAPPAASIRSRARRERTGAAGGDLMRRAGTSFPGHAIPAVYSVGHSKGALMNRLHSLAAAAACLVVFLLPASLRAQLNNASAIRGVVKD